MNVHRTPGSDWLGTVEMPNRTRTTCAASSRLMVLLIARCSLAVIAIVLPFRLLLELLGFGCRGLCNHLRPVDRTALAAGLGARYVHHVLLVLE